MQADEEAQDIEAEAEYWRNYKPNPKGWNCFTVLAALVLSSLLTVGGVLWWV